MAVMAMAMSGQVAEQQALSNKNSEHDDTKTTISGATV
jgi:hypothetical protein